MLYWLPSYFNCIYDCCILNAGTAEILQRAVHTRYLI